MGLVQFLVAPRSNALRGNEREDAQRQVCIPTQNMGTSCMSCAVLWA